MNKCTCAFPCGGTEESCPCAPGYGVKTLTLHDKKYSSEELSDLSRDVHEAFDERFQPLNSQIPQAEYGFTHGTYHVTITWVDDADE